MSTETLERPITGEKVREGMLLAVRDERGGDLPTKHDLWTVKRVGKPTKAGHVTATLVAAGKTFQMEATARFPEGVVGDPWRPVWFSAKDRQTIWERSRPATQPLEDR